MATARAVRAIVRVDALRLFRDRFLLGASAYIVACAVAVAAAFRRRTPTSRTRPIRAASAAAPKPTRLRVTAGAVRSAS